MPHRVRGTFFPNHCLGLADNGQKTFVPAGEKAGRGEGSEEGRQENRLRENFIQDKCAEDSRAEKARREDI